MNYKRKLPVQAIQLNQTTDVEGNKIKKDMWIVFENGYTYYYDDKQFRELYESTVMKLPETTIPTWINPYKPYRDSGIEYWFNPGICGKSADGLMSYNFGTETIQRDSDSISGS